MQATKLICPTCAAKIQIARVLPRGAKGKCPRCGTIFAVPDPDEAARAPAPATMAARPDVVDDDAEGGDGRPRRRKRRQTAASGGVKSYIALVVAGAAVLGFVAYLAWVFWDAAYSPYRQQPDVMPTSTITIPGR
jgi:hypothetical protein